MEYKSDIYTKIDYENRFSILKKTFIPFVPGILLIIAAFFLQPEK